MATNLQGLTTQGMGQLAEDQMKNRVITDSMANPGQVVTGAQMGNTQPGQIAQSPINFQAYTNPSSNVSDAMSVQSKGTLTSAPADAYLKGLRKEMVQYDQTRRDKEYASSGQVYEDLKSSDPNIRLRAERALGAAKESDLRRMANESANFLQRQNSQEDINAIRWANERGLSANESVGVPSGFTENIKDLKAKLEPQEARFREAQAEQRGTAAATAFRMGQTGSSYGDSAKQKLETEMQRQSDELSRQTKDLVQSALASAIGGNIETAERFRNEAQRTFQERMQIEDLAMKQSEQLSRIREYEDNAAIRAEEKAGRTIQNLVSVGFTANDIPKEYLQGIEQSLGMPSGYGEKMFSLAQEERMAAQIGNEEEARTKRIENAKKLVDILGQTSTGGTVNIDGVDYSVQGKTPEYVTGTEIDNDGNGTLWSFNKTSGQVSSTPLGQIGSAKDGWETQTLSDGSIWRINPKTGQSQPFYASPAQVTWNATLPEGEIGPVLPGNPSAAGQCGAFCNWAYGDRILGNTFSEKQKQMSQYVVQKEDVQVGDTFLMKAGSTGHVGIVNSVDYGPDGKVILKFSESNYVPPGGGLMSHSRTMSIDDPRLSMFARIPTPNLPMAGSDSPATRLASGGISPPQILGAGTKKTTTTEPTASMREYEYARQEGYKGTFADWTKKSSASSTQLSDAQIKTVEKSPEAKQLLSMGDLKSKLNAYRDVASQPEGFDVVGSRKNVLDSLYADLQVAWKEAANLGALTGPDLALIQAAVKPISGISNIYGYISGGGQQGVISSIDTALKSIDSKGSKYAQLLQSKYPEFSNDPYLTNITSPFSNTQTSESLPKEKAPPGEIWVRTSDGQIGSIPESEFDSKLYTKI